MMNKYIPLLAAGAFASSLAAAAPLGAGDVVKVSVYGSPDLTLETRIAEDGKLAYPLIGDVQVEGLEPPAVERKIASMLAAGGYLKRPQVNLLVVSMQSQQVSVLGNVMRPGRYPMEGRRSLLDVLALAGGINPEGGDVAVIVRKRDGSPAKEVVNVPDMMRSADLSQNVQLGGGDVVYIERAPKFYIYGEVQRPGVYRLERNMTVVQALSTGGGLNQRGTERRMTVKRRDERGVLHEVSVRQDDILLPDDVIYVKESLF